MPNEIIAKRNETSKTFDLGNGKKQLVACGGPIHFKNNQANWEDIVLDFQDDGKGNWIADKNKVSCGFRKDKKLNKYFGLRYDEEHQFEASVNKIELDSVEQISGNDFSLSAERKTKQSISNKVNSNVEIINRLSEISLKNYFKITNSIKDFKITEELHLKGLTCSNKKSGSKYVPDEKNRFNFVDEKSELKLWINPPFFIDADSITSKNVAHSLEEIDKRFFYTKTPTLAGKDDLILSKFPIEIDADTSYSSTADGVVEHSGSTTWATIHDAETGTAVDDVGPGTGREGEIEANGNSDAKDDNQIARMFLYFDTSGIGSGQAVTDAVLSLYGKTYDEGNVCVQKGTQASSLTTADYDSFTGVYYDTIIAASWSEIAYNDFTFNETGEGDVEMEGITKICFREYTHDYLDSDPVNDTYRNGCWTSEELETGERRPRLVVTYEASGGATYRRRIIINGFMKLKTTIIIGALITSFLLGGVMEFLSNKQECKYYIWHKGEKECVSEQLKEYIENVESGNVDRLKSKRGVKINQ